MSISCPDCGEDARASGTRHIKYRNVQRRIRTCPNGHKFITIEQIAEQEDLYMNEKQRRKDYFKKMLLELANSL
jgi:transcriptional regulator NrdR family protein|tara:strand:- start:47 stop:268 length:222 start_codon:yes stop_codon:yes gene_type:complete